MIPLSKVYIDDDIKKAVSGVLDSGWFIFGEKLKEFESRFAKFAGTKFAIGTSSGTSAIHLALEALEVGPKHEVIVPSHTAFPTVEPILNLGAVPVFVDIDPRTYTINPDKVEEQITDRTKGILPVHLYGHPADMGVLKKIADKNDVFLLEDCCQAHGAKYKDKRVGAIGDAGCFSFYPSKNMTVCGDGGMITTNDSEMNERIRILLNHGAKDVYKNIVIGHNYRMSEISAAIGLKQLSKLEMFTEKRRKIAGLYSELLDGSVELPIEEKWAYHVYHLYVIRTRNRDKVAKYLREHGITTGVHYPIPSHQQKAITDMRGRKYNLPVTEKYKDDILSLPIYPMLSEGDAITVAETLKKSLK